jgi:hypothetical protein
MGLAQVQVSLSDFQQLHDHLMTHNPRCRNMHLRDFRTEDRRRVMRHLHAVYATSANVISGMISGPGVFCHYDLVLVRGQPQWRVPVEECSQPDADRSAGRCLREVVSRMRDERTSDLDHPVNRSEGQLYLQRRHGGMSPDHEYCVDAIEREALDGRFVAQLAPWNLALIRGKPQRPRRRRP